MMVLMLVTQVQYITYLHVGKTSPITSTSLSLKSKQSTKTYFYSYFSSFCDICLLKTKKRCLGQTAGDWMFWLRSSFLYCLSLIVFNFKLMRTFKIRSVLEWIMCALVMRKHQGWEHKIWKMLCYLVKYLFAVTKYLATLHLLKKEQFSLYYSHKKS